MKRKLAVCTVLCTIAGAAAAQTNITIYGIVDEGFAYENAGAGRVLRLDSGLQSGSRIGFKGTEDLGGSLKANFVLESGFAADTGGMAAAGVLFNRQSYVSLSGDLGEVKLGRIQTMVYSNAAVFDPFGDTLAGDSARLFNYGGSRTDNTVNYSYNAANGLNGQAAYSAGETAGNSVANRTMAGAFGYAAGPVAVVLTHQNTKNATGNDGAKTTLLGGNYTIGPVQAFAAYAVNKGLAALNTRDALLGLRLKVSTQDVLIASVIHKYDKAVDHADATQIALGYTHDLSVRTNLYASISRLSNGYASAYKVTAAGKNDTLASIGIRHKF